MTYTLNKIRGNKHAGRGHRKNKSGSKGGTGRAGHRTHMPLPYKLAKPKRLHYIRYSVFVKHWATYEKKGVITSVNGQTVIMLSKLKKKLLALPANAPRLYGTYKR